MFYWIALPFAVIFLTISVVIIGRHWKEIRLLDPDSIKEERARQKREQLIQQRFDRLRSDTVAPLRVVTQRTVIAIKRAFHAAYLKLIQLDRFYKRTKAPFAHVAPSAQDRIRTLLDEARSLARDLKWADAERRFLEILTMDDRNVDAYKGLASIYIKQKMFAQAKETYTFLIKMKKGDAGCYEGLAQVAEAEHDDTKAESLYVKAMELQPKSPHLHICLAEFYLGQERLEEAEHEANIATELEPKSLKYLELLLEITLRLGKREEARRQYDALRLLSDDRRKLQAFKERIDALGMMNA